MEQSSRQPRPCRSSNLHRGVASASPRVRAGRCRTRNQGEAPYPLTPSRCSFLYPGRGPPAGPSPGPLPWLPQVCLVTSVLSLALRSSDCSFLAPPSGEAPAEGGTHPVGLHSAPDLGLRGTLAFRPATYVSTHPGSQAKPNYTPKGPATLYTLLDTPPGLTALI